MFKMARSVIGLPARRPPSAVQARWPAGALRSTVPARPAGAHPVADRRALAPTEGATEPAPRPAQPPVQLALARPTASWQMRSGISGPARAPALFGSTVLTRGYKTASKTPSPREAKAAEKAAARTKEAHEKKAAYEEHRELHRAKGPLKGHPATAAAKELGYHQRIPWRKLPFDSHRQPGFFDGKHYITADVDGHLTGAVWKKVHRNGDRVGTYDANLVRIGK